MIAVVKKLFLLGLILGGGILYFFNIYSSNTESNKVISTKTPSHQAETSTETYTNTRFGFAIDFPAIWPVGRESDNGDGVTVNVDNSDNKILVYGSNFSNSFLDQKTTVESNTIDLTSGIKATSIKYKDQTGKIVYIVYFNQESVQYTFYASVTEEFLKKNELTLLAVIKSFRLLNTNSL